MKDKIIIDLSKFEGKTPNELKGYIEVLLSNIRIDVLVKQEPKRTQKVLLNEFIDFNTQSSYGNHSIDKISNENIL